jgi:hypothetical protein
MPSVRMMNFPWLSLSRIPSLSLRHLNTLKYSQILKSVESESESYVTTDSQSASLSWYKAPIWAYDQIFVPVRNTEYVGQFVDMGRSL